MEGREIITMLEELAPPSYAFEWDNPGLVCGRKTKEVKKIMVALDATNTVIERAVAEQVDLIVTHHPMIFSGIKKVNDDSFLGEKILTLAEHGIGCFAMHTNYDIAGGMAEICGEKMQLLQPAPLEETHEIEGRPVGIGQAGYLPKTMTVRECACQVKAAFGLSDVLVFGDLDREVSYVAISPGSGRSILKEAKKKGVDVLITGDIGHHEGLDSMDMGFAVIEAGHYGLEQVFIQHVTDYLMEKTEGVEVIPCGEGVPYQVI